MPVACTSSPNCTVAGSRIGLRNWTSVLKLPGSRGCSAARHRAFVHIPWAIAVGKPNALALSECMWIGFMSPDTDA